MAFDRVRKSLASWAAACALALAFALVAADAAANSVKKPLPDTNPGAPESAISDRAPGSAARYFTINDMLARSGYQRAGVAAGAATDASSTDLRGQGPEPFGLYAFRAPDGQLWQKWRALNAELDAELVAIERCRANSGDCTAAAARFVAIAAEAESRSGRARLETANRLINGAIRYAADSTRHGASDRWSAPLASLADGRGDCEDYAIAKYVALRAARVPEADMRLVLLRDTAQRVDHAVLAVREEDRWLVLDNQRAAILEAGVLRHYQPLFAVNAEGVKLFAAPYAAWGEDTNSEFAGWALRGAEFAEWTLRDSLEPAARGF